LLRQDDLAALALGAPQSALDVLLESLATELGQALAFPLGQLIDSSGEFVGHAE
jgi:hypothetical protein